MSKTTIQVPAVFSGFSSRSDGGASLRFATQELNEVDFSALKKMHNSFGYVLFRPNEWKESDIPKEDATDETKSPAKRLRAALFVLYKQRGSKGSFEDFYRQNMEDAIERVKKCLD
jgi:hypothetical protein